MHLRWCMLVLDCLVSLAVSLGDFQSTKSSWLLSTTVLVTVSHLCFQLNEKSFAKVASFKSDLERC